MAIATDLSPALPVPSPGEPAPRRSRWWRPPARRLLTAVAGLGGAVTVVCAVLLPFAPVSVGVPTVAWPTTPGMPESTLLGLTAFRPLALDVRFDCAAARAAGETDGQVVMATALPGAAEAGQQALLVRAVQERLRIEVFGGVLLDEPLPPGPCRYRISGTGPGTPVYVVEPAEAASRFDPAVPILREPPPDPGRYARPGDAQLVVTRDGQEIGRAGALQLPDVDVLVSSLSGVPGPHDLAVELRLDELPGSPTPQKRQLAVALGAGLAVTALALGVLGALGHGRPGRRWWTRLRRWWREPWRSWGAPDRGRVAETGTAPATHLVVGAALTAWLFLAPATDDDGWFSVQARNAALTGEVGAYFQLYDHSFVPFTWVTRGLAGWQGYAGLAPVAQRVPALLFGLLTWLLVSRVGSLAAERRERGTRMATRAALAVVFLAWWLPFGMGVRPEAVVACCAVAALAGVLEALRRGQPLFAWAACAAAGVACAAHPTGLVALGPLVAGAASMRRTGLAGRSPGDAAPVAEPDDQRHSGTGPRSPEGIGRSGSGRATAASRILGGLPGLLPAAAVAIAVVSAGAAGVLLAFTDGSVRDLRRAEATVTSVLVPDGWAEEIQRYGFLLDQIPQGSYAKRAALLVCLVALVWFAVLAVAARVRGIAVPAALRLAAASTVLGLVALAFAPSKWSHHFGALAGVGPAFLAPLLVLAVPLTRRVLGGARPPWWLPVIAVASVLVPILLTWHGPNSWPYAWLDGVQDAYAPPAPGGLRLDSPLPWLVAFGAATLMAASARTWPTAARAGRAAAARSAAARPIPGATVRSAATGAIPGAALTAAPVIVLVSLATAVGYLLGTFGTAAARGTPPQAHWSQAVADPASDGCGAAGAVRVLDPFAAVTLPLAAGEAPPTGSAAGGTRPVPAEPAGSFVENAGYYPGNRPQGGAAGQVWGSLAGRDGLPGELTTGAMTTGWYALPDQLPEDAAVTVLAAGSLAQGNSLVARFAGPPGFMPAEPAPGRHTPRDPLRDLPGEQVTEPYPVGGQAPIRSGTQEPDIQILGDDARSPTWRTFALEPPPGATLVRLEAVDASAGPHGWLAFTAPAAAPAVTLQQLLPGDAPVALGWQLAFGYPCQRVPIVADGVTEPAAFAVLRAEGPLGGLADLAFQERRGGVFAHVPRSQSVLQLATVAPADPYLQVYAFGTDLRPAAYRLAVEQRVVPGGAPR